MSRRETDHLPDNGGPNLIDQPLTYDHRKWMERRQNRWMLHRVRRINFEKVNRHTREYAERFSEGQRRRRTPHPINEKCPVFVVGSNRSGTQMVNRAIGRSPHAWAYPESDYRAFKSFYLRSDWIIKWLIFCSPTPIVSFGSINDSQSTDELLSKFKSARAIWVYRRYQDAANSSVRRFGNHHKNLARAIANGELTRLAENTRQISDNTVQLFNNLYHESLTDEEGSCLYWIMRNQLFFDLNLDKDPRVLIVQYEDAVQNPERAFQRIFDFLGFPYDSAIINGIFPSSVGKHPWPGFDPRIQEACDDLRVRLDTIFAGTRVLEPAGSAKLIGKTLEVEASK